MAIFKLKTLEVEIIRSNVFVGYKPILLMIKDECHIIGGSHSRIHYKWNSKLKQLEKVFKFSHIYLGEGIHLHATVHIKSQNKLLLFGGYHDEHESLDDIWEFDTNFSCSKDKKWIKLDNIKL